METLWSELHVYSSEKKCRVLCLNWKRTINEYKIIAGNFEPSYLVIVALYIYIYIWQNKALLISFHISIVHRKIFPVRQIVCYEPTKKEHNFYANTTCNGFAISFIVLLCSPIKEFWLVCYIKKHKHMISCIGPHEMYYTHHDNVLSKKLVQLTSFTFPLSMSLEIMLSEIDTQRQVKHTQFFPIKLSLHWTNIQHLIWPSLEILL